MSHASTGEGARAVRKNGEGGHLQFASDFWASFHVVSLFGGGEGGILNLHRFADKEWEERFVQIAS